MHIPAQLPLQVPRQEPWQRPTQLPWQEPWQPMQVPEQVPSQPSHIPEGCVALASMRSVFRSAFGGAPWTCCARRAASISCWLSARLVASIFRLAPVSSSAAAPPAHSAVRKNCLRSAESTFGFSFSFFSFCICQIPLSPNPVTSRETSRFDGEFSNEAIIHPPGKPCL